MKPTSVTLYDELGNDRVVEFPSARLAREAESACRQHLLKVLEWTKNDARLGELAAFVRWKIDAQRRVAPEGGCS